MALSISVALTCFLLSGGASAEPGNVYSTEHRRKPFPVSAENTASRLIGGLSKPSEDEPHCTAFLVGKDLALTAYHCVPLAGTFHFTLQDGGTASARIAAKPAGEISFPGPDDWAVLKLDHDLGSARGWFTPPPGGFALAPEKKDLSIAGYAPAFGGKLTIHAGCSYRGEYTTLGEGMFRHDCDMSMRDSGGPIWLTATSSTTHPVVVGIQDGERLNPKSYYQDYIIGHSTFSVYNDACPNSAIRIERVHEAATLGALRPEWTALHGDTAIGRRVNRFAELLERALGDGQR